MRHMFLALALLSLCPECRSGGGPWPRGARSVAMGGASSALSGDAWTASLNPGLATTIGTSLMVADYVPAPFGMADLSRIGVALGFPLGTTSLSMAAIRSGSALYRETWWITGCAFRLASDLSLGVAVSLLGVSIERYGSATALSVTFGGILQPLTDVVVGWTVVNAASTRLGRSAERPAPAVLAGATALILESLRVSLDLWKEERFPAEVHVGLEYSLLSLLTLRAGLTHEPALYCGGFGIVVGPGRLDYGVQVHPVLGSTHALSITLAVAEL